MISPATLTPVAFLAAGLAASLHCAVMCGPMVALVSGGRWSTLIATQLGRCLTYAALGAAAAALGAGPLLALQGLDPTITRGAALTAVLTALLVVRLRRQGTHKCPSRTQNQQHPALLRGAALALVPCPISLSLLGFAVLMANPLAAAGAMFAFGLGTSLPVILAARGMSTSHGLLHRWRWPAVSALTLATAIAVWMPRQLGEFITACLTV